MNIKTHIENEMAGRGAPLVQNSIGRIIRGEYRPRLGVAKELADLTGSKIDIWCVPAYSAERQLVVAKLAVKLGMSFHVGRGRPKKIKPKYKKSRGEKS